MDFFIGEPAHYDEEVGVYNGRALVRDPIVVRLSRALTVRTNLLNSRLGGHVQELEALVTPRESVIVVDRQSTEQEPVSCA